MNLLKGMGCLIAGYAVARFAWRQHRSSTPPLGLYHPLPMVFMMPGLAVPLAMVFFGSYVSKKSPINSLLAAIGLAAIVVGIGGFVLHAMMTFGWFPKSTDSWMYPSYGTDDLMQRRLRSRQRSENRKRRGRE